MNKNIPFAPQGPAAYELRPAIRHLDYPVDSNSPPLLAHDGIKEEEGSYFGELSRFSKEEREAFLGRLRRTDSMSEAPSGTPPHLSDVSSVDSPRTSLEQTTSSNLSSTSSRPPQSEHAPNFVLDHSRRQASPESDDRSISSDDDLEGNLRKQHPFGPGPSALTALNSRRPSYKADFATMQRAYPPSSSNNILTPMSSNPNAPGGDTTGWAAGINAQRRDTIGPWSGSIWNSDPSRKSPPKPLSNLGGAVKPGPATAGAMFSSPESVTGPTDILSSIPLQPQLRNYRSSSFSVGQSDDVTRQRQSPTLSGNRQPPPAGLQHRPNQSSHLAKEQFASQGSPLRNVFEEEGEDEYHQQPSQYLPSLQSQRYQQQQQQRPFRGRSASAATVPTAASIGPSGLSRELEADKMDGSDYALADEEEYNDSLGSGAPSAFNPHYSMGNTERRFSEAGPSIRSQFSNFSMTGSTRKVDDLRQENLRRQQWGGSLPGLEGSQSRRHSFAGLPGPGADFRNDAYNDNRDPSPPGFQDRNANLRMLDESRLRPGRSQGYPGVQNPLIGPGPRTPPGQAQLSMGYSAGRLLGQPSPPPALGPRGGLGYPAVHGTHGQQRTNQLLYLVTFKACRADVFYIQEGTGLRVHNGDLVIVEADRGTDLGTVIGENISWQQAKALKQQYSQQHYKWLMLTATRRVQNPGAPQFQNQLGGPPTPSFVNGSEMARQQGGAASMGDGIGQMGEDPATQELKPKMIKRLAQVHEIQTLREKEANEAKAKRVCQQKVLEHRLPMEILDAEFQMDWKKLTFYYFADSYINFNSLVTDLFKVYKTRIWMSAMNPGAFSHPSAGVGPLGEMPPHDQPSYAVQAPYEAPQTQQSYTGSSQQYGGRSRDAGLSYNMQSLQAALPDYSAGRVSPHSIGSSNQEYSHHSQAQNGSYGYLGGNDALHSNITMNGPTAPMSGGSMLTQDHGYGGGNSAGNMQDWPTGLPLRTH